MTNWQPIETAPKDGSYILTLAKYETAPIVVSWRPRWTRPSSYGWVVSDVGLRCTEDCHGIEQELTDNDFIVWAPVPEIPTFAN
jgi:hypothetical protein